MSDQHTLEAVRANTEAMNARSWDSYMGTFAEDALWEDEALPGPVLGPAAAAQTMEAFYAAFPDLHFEVERELACGNQGAVAWRVTGTHEGEFAGIPATGRRISYHAAGIFELRDGKITYVRTYIPTAVLLRQIGALPGGD